MSFLQVLKGLKFSYIIKIFGVSLLHPFFACATFWATKETYKKTQQLFPGIHGKENIANAFRHALWNMFIIHKCLGISKSIEKVRLWAKEITDLHEELAPNRPISRAMDLKNNQLGREWFVEMKFQSREEIENFLLLKINEAIHVSSLQEIESAHQLVYLESQS